MKQLQGVVHVIGSGQTRWFSFTNVVLWTVLVNGHDGRQEFLPLPVGNEQVSADTVDRCIEHWVRQFDPLEGIQIQWYASGKSSQEIA